MIALLLPGPEVWLIGALVVGFLSVLAVLVVRRRGEAQTRQSLVGLLVIGVLAIALTGMAVRATQNVRWKAKSSVIAVRTPGGVRIHDAGNGIVQTPASIALSKGVFAPELTPEEIIGELRPGATILHSEQIGLTINETPFGHWVVIFTRALLEERGGALDPIVLLTRSIRESPTEGQRVIEIRVRRSDPEGPGEFGWPEVTANGVEYPQNTDWERRMRLDDPPQAFLELDARPFPEEVRAAHPDAPLADLPPLR